MVTTTVDELEKKINQEYSKDGFLEIFLAIALVLSAAMVERGVFPGTFALFPVFVLLMKRAWRKKITYPRLGYAEIMDDRRLQLKRRLPGIILALVVTGIIMAVLVYFRHHGGGSSAHQSLAGLTLGVGIVVVLLAFAAVDRAWQLLYSVIPAIVIISIAYWQKWPLEIALLISALIAFGVGVYRLVSFLRNNPRLDREDFRENATGK
jgi:hypothetical protein